MPARYHVKVLKPFDRYRVGEDAILSENGFNNMQAKKPGYVEVRFKEDPDGKVFDANGKPAKLPDPADKPKS
jgi:hypothetical protein